MILLVTYDLHGPGRNYEPIFEVLQSADDSHPMGSVWFLDTEEGPAVWRDRLTDAADSNDEFFVVRLHRNWAAMRMDKDAVEWLKNAGRRW